MIPPPNGMLGERSCLSLIVGGSSTNAALGSVSAGGIGTPELDVTHAILDQPCGNTGGVTLSKYCVRSTTGSHCGGEPDGAALSRLNTDEVIDPSAITLAAPNRSKQAMSHKYDLASICCGLFMVDFI